MAEAQAAARVDARRWFYHWMALTCLAIAVIGFMPTFFVPVVQGTFPRPAMTYLHGLLFFSWTIYFCTQTRLAATGRVTAHREWGLLGVALATAMAFSVLTVSAVRLHENPPRPPQLVMLDFSSLLLFEACVVAALANVRRPETHKRFMLLATIFTMGAPIGRWYAILMGPLVASAASPDAPPPGPLTVVLLQGPTLLASLLIVVAMVFDWRTRGRVSLIYAIGLPVFVMTVPLMMIFVVSTPGWLAVVDWLRGFGGTP